MRYRTAPALGTYVDGWWGQYGPARALTIAKTLGAPVAPAALALAEQHLATMGPSDDEPVAAEALEIIAEALDEAEASLAANDRTGWGWHDGTWGHQLLDPETHPWPSVTWTADIYDHGDDGDDDGPYEHARGWISPTNCWAPVDDPTGLDGYRHTIDLEDEPYAYTPAAVAALALDHATRLIGSVDHIEARPDTGTAILYGADTHHDYAGTVGHPRARFFSTRAAIVTDLQPDELDALVEYTRTKHPGALTHRATAG